ncbi:PEP-CTERM sorting domain-containing protein [Phycisphaerales bacterium AB-hyl4]|uniref:PEP-CTERM sorting domain-containing protein n=1 Tax=Natronomicrosphaera hydrolytica TaxID=3242702 RepID=A0ABV4U8V3_9BACT
MKLQVTQRLFPRAITLAGLGFAVVGSVFGTAAHADVIVSSDLTYLTTSRAEMTAVDDNVTVSEYTAHGNTAFSTSRTHFIRVDTAGNAARLATISDSVDNDLYGEFEITVDSGWQMNLSSLDIGMQLSRGADTESFTVHLRSSLDNFAEDIAATTLGGDGSVNVVNGSGSFDLSDAAFQALTDSVTFRMYMVTDIGSRTDGSQYVRIMPDVVLNGTVVPEPGTLGLAALGSVFVLGRCRRVRTA